MRILFIITLFFASGNLSAQVVTKTLAVKQLPPSTKYKGKYKQGISWTDSIGVHTVFMTETGVIDSPPPAEDGSRSANLYAYHLVSKNSINKTVWTLNDGVEDCPVDVEANFLSRKIVTTDLDKDGIPEIWLVYQVGCHGDVSPLDMKIIMHEGASKFAVRGHTKVRVGEKEYDGGDYKLDASFQKAPAAFAEYAKRFWQQHVNAALQTGDN